MHISFTIPWWLAYLVAGVLAVWALSGLPALVAILWLWRNTGRRG